MPTPYVPFPGAQTDPAITAFQVLTPGDPASLEAPLDATGAAFTDAVGALYYWNAAGQLVTKPAVTFPTSKRVVAPWAPVLADGDPAPLPPPSVGAHPLDTAPHGTTAVVTPEGVVTISPDHHVTAPNAADVLHGQGLPPHTTFVKTADGIDVHALVPAAHRSRLGEAFQTVKHTVPEAVAWLQTEWRTKIERQAPR